jgi:molybdate transport system ATP-binding protein
VTLAADLDVAVGGFRLEAQLAAEPGEVVAVLGPNGAGKTTLLSALAGLAALDRGRITIAGAVVDDPGAGMFVAAEHRPVAVVFQDHLLFPHLSVLDNVAYGIRRRSGRRRADARRDALAWLDRVGLADRAADRPTALSGGQAQRVALVRALATGPALLLLDEPLAALDVQTRDEIRGELRRHLRSFAGATVLVTHDPVDAATLADRVVVLHDGRVVQDGPVADLTAHPRSAFVAALVGTNLYEGEGDGDGVRLPAGRWLATASHAAGPALALIDPTAVALHRARPEGSPRNVWSGRVETVDRLGDRARIRVDGEPAIVAEVTAEGWAALGLTDGDEVWVSVKATEITVLPA